MGVVGLSSHIRRDFSSFRTTRLHNSFIVFDGFNMINHLYINSGILTQYNGEYMAFDVATEGFILKLRQCNLEPIFVFDGIHEVSKLQTVLRRTNDRLITCFNLQKAATNRPIKDGCSDYLRISVQPPLVSTSFLSILDRLGVFHITVDFEADQLAAALAIHLGAPLVSNDSDFFIFAPYWASYGGLIFIPTDLCDFETTHAFDGGHYLEAQMFVAKEGRTFRNLAPIQLPLFAVLCGNDYTPPGYFNSRLPGSAPQQPFVRPTGQAASKPAVFSRNAEKFRRLGDWLSGFGDDIVEPVDRIISRFPIAERPQAAHYLHTGLASYYVPMDQLTPYLEYLFGREPPSCSVTQVVPHDLHPSSQQYGLRALQILAEGIPGPQLTTGWSPRLTNFFRQRRIMPAYCDAIYSFGIMMGSGVEDVQNRESNHLCSLPLRQLFVGLLLGASTADRRTLPGVNGPSHRPFFCEYRRVGCSRIEKHRVNFERQSLRGSRAFVFLQQKLCLPDRPPVIPAWLHGLACILFLWARFDARPETARLCCSPIALAVCACAIAAQIRLLGGGSGDNAVRVAMVRNFWSLRPSNVTEPLNFSFLHALAQLQSVHYGLATLVSLVDALATGDDKCGVEVLPPQVVFPSGRLAHHIACQLSKVAAAERLRTVVTDWLPRLVGKVETRLLEQVTSMYSGLMKFVDSLIAATPPAAFRAFQRPQNNEQHISNHSEPSSNAFYRETDQSQASTSGRSSASRAKRPMSGVDSTSSRLEDAVKASMQAAGLENDI
uniref:XPG_I_2 domain-containing protein n=1 Tax=Mesocestoides corti TaxID=53468 RepID=A0A5K3FBN7_MESCO